MGLGCGTTVVKYVLFVFNFLIALGGIALCALGIVALVAAGDLKDAFKENDPTFAAIILIVFGSVVFLISFFGCCGAIKENHCMTMTYASILLIIFIGQVVIGVYVLLHKEDFKTAVLDAVGKIFVNASAPGNSDTVKAIERSLSCCGWTDPKNPLNSILSVGSCVGELNFNTDCRTAMSDWITSKGNLLGWVAIGVAAVELVALIFACCLGNNIRNAERRYA